MTGVPLGYLAFMEWRLLKRSLQWLPAATTSLSAFRGPVIGAGALRQGPNPMSDFSSCLAFLASSQMGFDFFLPFAVEVHSPDRSRRDWAWSTPSLGFFLRVS